MKTPMTPVRTVPETTSTRSKVRSPAVRRLSVAYDWMNASPRRESRPNNAGSDDQRLAREGRAGKTRPRPVALRVGVQSAPAAVGDKGGVDEQEDALDTVEAARSTTTRRALRRSARTGSERPPEARGGAHPRTGPSCRGSP